MDSYAFQEMRRQNVAETSGKMYVSASSLTNAKTTRDWQWTSQDERFVPESNVGVKDENLKLNLMTEIQAMCQQHFLSL